MISEMDQTDIPDWIKYEVGLKCAEVRGEPSAVLAKLALEGSYACRRAMVSALELPGLSRIIPAQEAAIVKQGGSSRDPRSEVRVIAEMLRNSKQIELKKKRGRPLSVAEKYYLYLRLAGCWDRVGDADKAAESLKEAAKSVGSIKAPPRLTRPMLAVVAYRSRMLSLESRFRARAVKEMRKALTADNAYPRGAVIPTAYLLGELYRRQEQYDRARTWLVLASRMAGSLKKEHPLAGLAEETMALPGMRAAGTDPREEAAALELVARLTGREPGELVRRPAAGPGDPAGGADGPVSARPTSCSECLANIHRAYSAWVRKHRKAPPDLQSLINAGLITKEAAGGLKCPGCGAALRYRRPRKLTGGDELLVWCKKLILYADGKTKSR
jgi:hypothetical protein